MTQGKLFVFSGPSGVGKSTVLKELLARRKDLYFSVSATTRPPRPGEIDRVHYHFRTVEEFRALIEAEALLEWAEYVGNYYGTPAKYVDEAMAAGRDVLLDIEVQGASKVRQKRPEAVHVFIAPPSWAELERRLTARGTDTPEKIKGRLLRAREEFEHAREYDYIVINDEVERAVSALDAIMTAEHCRPAEQIARIAEGEPAAPDAAEESKGTN